MFSNFSNSHSTECVYIGINASMVKHRAFIPFYYFIMSDITLGTRNKNEKFEIQDKNIKQGKKNAVI